MTTTPGTLERLRTIARLLAAAQIELEEIELPSSLDLATRAHVSSAAARVAIAINQCAAAPDTETIE